MSIPFDGLSMMKKPKTYLYAFLFLTQTVSAVEICGEQTTQALRLYDDFASSTLTRRWMPFGDGNHAHDLDNGKAKLSVLADSFLHSAWIGLQPSYLAQNPVPEVIEAELTLSPASVALTPTAGEERGIGIRLDGILFSDESGADVVASFGIDKKVINGVERAGIAVHVFRKGDAIRGHIGADLVPWQMLQDYDGQPHALRLAWTGTTLLFLVDGVKIFEFTPSEAKPAFIPEAKVNAFSFPGSSVIGYVDNVYFGTAAQAESSAKCKPEAKILSCDDNNVLALYDDFEHGDIYRQWSPAGKGGFFKIDTQLDNSRAELMLKALPELHSIWLGLDPNFAQTQAIPQVIEADLTLDSASTVPIYSEGIGLRLDGVFFSVDGQDVVASLGVDKKHFISGEQELLALHIFKRPSDGSIGEDLITWKIIRLHDGKEHKFRMAWNGEQIFFIIDDEKVFEYKPTNFALPQQPEVKINAFAFPDGKVVARVDNVYFGYAEAAEATSTCEAAPKENINNQLSGLGRAILFTSGGAKSSNTLYSHSHELVQDMYRLLQQKGFSDGDIVLMTPFSPDINLDGHEDPELRDFKLLNPDAELRDAFERVAKTLSAGQQFILYVHGRSKAENLEIDTDVYFSAQTLKQYLDLIPADIQQVIILDIQFSETFLDDIAAQNRLIVAATRTSDKWFYNNGQGFSGHFIRSLRSRRSGDSSLLNALQFTQTRISTGQTPVFDADGDALQTSRDENLAARIELGQTTQVVSTIPEIIETHPEIRLSGNDIEAELWVKTAQSGKDIRNVRATLQPLPLDNQAESAQEIVTLGYNSALERHETLYRLRKQGTWQISYQAQGIDGSWSEAAISQITQEQDYALTTVSIRLHQSSYTIGETIRADMSVNGNDTVDLLVGLIFPDGNFVTLFPQQGFSLPGTLIPYKESAKITGNVVYSVLNTEIVTGSILGEYQLCGAVIPENSNPWLLDEWQHFSCSLFTIK